MDLQRTQIILFIAFILSLSGLMLSVFYPETTFSDDIMITSMFVTSLPLVISKLAFQQLMKTVYWRFMLIGFCILIYCKFGPFYGDRDLKSTLFVIGSIIVIIPLLIFGIKLNSKHSSQPKWLLFLPMIFLSILFKMMHWPGGNIIFGLCLLTVIGSSVYMFIRRKNYSLVSVFVLLWVIFICVSIGAYYFHYVRRDYFILGALLICSALLEILLKQEEIQST